MTEMGKQSPVSTSIKLCLSAALLIFAQQQAVASVPEQVAATIEPSLQNLLLEEPQLPPLGVPSLYLPSETGIPSSIQLVIKLSERRVYVYQGDAVKTSYPIAVGKAGWETPTGTYTVLEMQRNPAWEHPWTGEIIPPGPTNPLGSGWIGFWTDGNNLIGFHGTPDENLIGQAVSHGCVRMRNQDILALYSMVNLGTTVTVKP